MKITKTLIIEVKFSFEDKKKEEQEDIYNLFKKSYEETLGTSWDENKFRSRAKNWLFFGDENGYIAVRVQRSGFYKLVGVAGNIKSVYRGFEELLSLNVPVWGMVSSNIQKMVLKKGFKTPPTFLLKTLLKTIPKETFGGVDFDVNSDGSVTLKYSDVGDARKYFIGNDEYFKSIKKNILPTLKDKLSTIARKGIEMFLNEAYIDLDVINEDITSGGVIVYHRTGRDGQSPIEGIASDGYRVGGRAFYGVGVYTTYTLESQLTDYTMWHYGNIVIESKVISMDKFLIFDYDVSKIVYGGKNYTLDKQLRLILGNEWNKYKDDDRLKELISNIGMTKYTSEVAKRFFDQFITTIIPKLRGIVFTGSNDGNVLVSYDRKNVEPIRYTIDNGKTWKNIINKNIYQRLKGYNVEERSTEYQHVINNLEIGVEISNDQFKLLTQEQMGQYAMKFVEKHGGISDDKFELLIPEQQNGVRLKIFQYAIKMVEKGGHISYDQFKLLTPDQQIQYAMKFVEKHGGISTDQFELLTPEQQNEVRLKIFQYAMKRVKNGGYILDNQFKLLTQDQQIQYLTKMAENGGDITYYQFELLTQDQRFQWVMKRAENGYRIFYNQFELLTPEQRKIFIDNGGKVHFY